MATIIDHTTGTIYGPDGAAQAAYNWWALVLRGVLALLVAAAAFFLPGATLAGLVFAFGAYALIDGGLTLVQGLRTRRETARWWAPVLQGLLGVGAGLAAFFLPAVTSFAVLYLVSAWAIVTGVTEIAAAVKLRREIDNEWLLGLSGLASVGLGLLMFFAPGAGALAWIGLFGVYAAVAGGLLIGLGLRLRSLQRRLADSAPARGTAAGATEPNATAEAPIPGTRTVGGREGVPTADGGVDLAVVREPESPDSAR